MKDLDAVAWITNKTSILDVVNNALNDAIAIAPDRKKWMKLLVQHPINQNAIKIAKSLL